MTHSFPGLWLDEACRATYHVSRRTPAEPRPEQPWWPSFVARHSPEDTSRDGTATRHPTSCPTKRSSWRHAIWKGNYDRVWGDFIENDERKRASISNKLLKDDWFKNRWSASLSVSVSVCFLSLCLCPSVSICLYLSLRRKAAAVLLPKGVLHCLPLFSSGASMCNAWQASNYQWVKFKKNIFWLIFETKNNIFDHNTVLPLKGLCAKSTNAKV